MKFQTLAHAEPTELLGCGGLAFDARQVEILVDLAQLLGALGHLLRQSGIEAALCRDAQSHYHAEVESKIITAKGQEFSVKYKLHAAGSGWNVDDVILISNYRSQFDRKLSKGSFAERGGAWRWLFWPRERLAMSLKSKRAPITWRNRPLRLTSRGFANCPRKLCTNGEAIDLTRLD